ncbi:MAG: 2,3-epoxybenzoyl-CoA dihydrolase [Acidimicrobiia bacterium]
MIDFRTHPDQYRHWRLTIDDRVARLSMNVDEEGGLGAYELKRNSYDLGVDIELYDAVQRLRFEHPEVGAVVVDSLKERIFCAGANISMLAQSSHGLKVNFCKFTNETRNGIEDASENSGQRYLAAINGTAAGGGYELALACDYILLIDDGSATVALPEVPLLGVLPGTGGLTRLVDKRKVRRDLADVFCTIEEGIKGRRAVEWGLVDELVSGSRFGEVVTERAAEFAARSDRPADATGITLGYLERQIEGDQITYPFLRAEIDRELNTVRLTLEGPPGPPPQDPEGVVAEGDSYWALALTRALDDVILHLRLNEPELGTLILATEGDPELVAAHDAFLVENRDHWLIREIVLYLKRTLKRLDVTSRSTLAFVEPGSCFVGFLAELIFASDRSYMLEGPVDPPGVEPKIRLTEMNFGALPMGNGLTRLASRFWGHEEVLEAAEGLVGKDLDAREAEEAGLVTFAFDDIDWNDEIRILLEERASFSPDSLTGMEANLRFVGPETVETKIFGRLTAWQNWVFQRPNASGERGALRSYGTGQRPDFDRERV